MKEKILEMENFRIKVEELFKDILPKVELRVTDMGGYKGFEFANNEFLFKGCDYEVDTNQSFLHFTKASSACQIINNGFFRCSEFKDFDDKQELNYALKEIMNDIKIDNTFDDLDSKNHFALSSVLYKNEESYLNNYMWEEYGGSFKGICIKFKLDSPFKINTLIGKVQYGDSGIQKINKLKDKFINLQIENSEYVIPNLAYCLSDLLVFHKEQKYFQEEEVRHYLLLNDTNKVYSYHSTDSFIKSVPDYGYYTELINGANNELLYRNYFKLFLEERSYMVDHDIKNLLHASKKKINNKIIAEEHLNYFRFYPKIKIEEIILGRELSPEGKYLANQFFVNCRKLYGYNYTIKHILENNTIRDYP